MKTKSKIYLTPTLNKIEIDSEISLVLASPPKGPGEDGAPLAPENPGDSPWE